MKTEQELYNKLNTMEVPDVENHEHYSKLRQELIMKLENGDTHINKKASRTLLMSYLIPILLLLSVSIVSLLVVLRFFK